MANDPAYNFMDYDSTNGNREAWDNFISDAQEARDVLKTLGEGGVVDVHKIDNMMNFMGRQLGAEGALSVFGYGKDSYSSLIDSINTFGATIDTTNADEVYAAFVRNIIASHNGLGEIDATILMKLGINVEEAAKGMEDGLKQFAKKQVEYWKQIRDMLVKMEELEDISAELKMDIRFVFGGKEGYASVPEMIEAFFNRPNDNTIVINGETYNVDASEVLETIYGRLYETFSKRTESDSILGLFTGEEFLRIFFGDNGQIDETELDNLRLFQNFDFDAFTEEQLRYISQKMVAATTGLTPGDIGYKEAILNVISEVLTGGIDNLPDVIGQDEYNTLAEKL